jgi:hypothetical protein
MIEAETAGQAPARPRAKPRARKPAAFEDSEELEDIGNVKKANRRCAASVYA